MKAGRILLLIATSATLLMLVGCVSPETIANNSQKEFQYSWSSYKLSEGYYTYGYSTTREGIKSIEIDLNISEAPSYGIEVWLMTEAEFYNFKNNGSVYVETHWTVYEGPWTLTFNSLDPYETYYVVIDNTDYGWVETDFDGEDDYAYFDADVYFTY